MFNYSKIRGDRSGSASLISEKLKESATHWVLYIEIGRAVAEGLTIK